MLDRLLVVFTTYAKMLLPLTTDIQGSRESVARLEEQNMTNLGGGLEIALQMSSESENPTTIILLSDGWTNRGPSRETILDSLSKLPTAQEMRICSAGFGTKEDDVDKELLGQLANNTGGKYLFTSSGAELVSFFIACRQSTVAENIVSFQGPINFGETANVGQFDIEQGTAELTLSLNFINGEPSLIITDPSGDQITANYSGLTQVFSPGLQLWKFQNPEPGSWKVEINSSGEGRDSGVYYLGVSTKLNPVVTTTVIPSDSTKKNSTQSIGATILWSSLVCIGVAFVFVLIMILSTRSKDVSRRMWMFVPIFVCLLLTVSIPLIYNRLVGVFREDVDISHAEIATSTSPHYVTAVPTNTPRPLPQKTQPPEPTFTPIATSTLNNISITSEKTSNGTLLHIKSPTSEYTLGPFPNGSYKISPSDKFIVYVSADNDGTIYISKIESTRLTKLGRLKQDHKFSAFFRGETPSYTLTLTDTLLTINEEKFGQSASYTIPPEYSE